VLLLCVIHGFDPNPTDKKPARSISFPWYQPLPAAPPPR